MQERYSIFASVGNARQPFDRFLRIVDEAAERAGLSAMIQTGHGAYKPRHAHSVDFVTRAEFEELVAATDYLVMHAGAGSVMSAVRLGKLPIVVPRRKAEGEMVNDHQLELATELSKLGWCRVVSTVEEMLECFREPPGVAPISEHISNQRMRELVTDFIR